MGFHRGHGNVQLLTDLGIGIALNETVGDFLFAGGKMVVVLRLLLDLVLGLEEGPAEIVPALIASNT